MLGSTKKTKKKHTWLQRFKVLNLSVIRYVCNINSWWRGRRDHLVICYTHGCGESSAPDVRGWRPSIHRGPPLHESEHQRGGSEGLFQRPPTEQSEGLPCQRRHLPQLRETDEALLSTCDMTSLLTVTRLVLQTERTSHGVKISPYIHKLTVVQIFSVFFSI